MLTLIVICLKNSYKTFVSPNDYHVKVIQKLKEFNEIVDKVSSIIIG